MDNDKDWLTSGLVFLGYRDLDIVKIANRVAHSFEALEEKVTSVRVLSDICAIVSTADHVVRLAICEDIEIATLQTPAEFFLAVQIKPNLDETGIPGSTPLKTDSVLAHTLTLLHWALSPDYVKWIGRTAVLSSADFIKATTQPEDHESLVLQQGTTPVSRAKVLPEIEETADILQQRLLARQSVTDQDHARNSDLRAIFQENYPTESNRAAIVVNAIRHSDLQRLSAWLMSFSVSLFCLPIGLALIVFNLIKGEDLRLSSQAAALTGTFIAFNAYGTTAQAMGAIQHLVG
ncbi:hypothetical protein [Roseovarius sp. EL26]|uniref:hypothetical protein n=1 Tax=Roseovarius sp. EL26 TaxID=2126672 RepID=UPI000EA17559|nr:hypothetical protein [Roseovarius sp. EL26]